MVVRLWTPEEWREEYTESDELEFDVELDKKIHLAVRAWNREEDSVRHRRITDSPMMPDEVPIPITSGFLTHSN